MKREVTEKDFRCEKFKDAIVEDYEFREDGEIVRKDRWEKGIRKIHSIVSNPRESFEIDEIIQKVQFLFEFYEKNKKDD